MRVYVPTTMNGLRRLAERGGYPEPPTFGSAVTPYLREYYSVSDQEELEYLILGAAAHDSLRLVYGDPDEERRRVVVALEVAADAVTPDPGAGPTAVRVETAVRLEHLVAVHVDGDDAVADVEAATAVADPDLGDRDTAALVAAVEDHELLWYGVQEIGDLVAH